MLNGLKMSKSEISIMRACIHRGSKEVGGSCVELECDGRRLLIDFGLPLDAQENRKKYLPRIAGLDGNDPSLLGILVSHPHIDHFGLLAHLPSHIPVGMGAAARRILTAAAPFMPGEPFSPPEGWDYQPGKSFDVGPFCITPFLVDHSAYDSYAFLIEAGGKRLFYSGDFRAHGRKASLFEKLISDPPGKIDALILEGTTIGRLGDGQVFPIESDVEKQLVEAFSDTGGLVMVQASAQNIDRVVSIMRASKRTGRRLVIDLYTAAILEATGNRNIPQSDWPELALYVPQKQRVQIKREKWFGLLDRHKSNRIFIEELHQASGKTTLLFRPLHIPDLGRGECLAGAAFIYSQWEGYWERGDCDPTKKWLEQNGIQKQSIHTSGHASTADLQRLALAIEAKKVIPIHSFLPDRYPEVFANVEVHGDGEWWEV
jgi:ribonuclease J